MSEIGVRAGLSRPFTNGTFQMRLNQFEDLIRDLTYQDAEATAEERRHMITENVRYDQFCEKIREIFGADIKNQDLKATYRKISTNPDAKVDWSELFGYFQSAVEEEEIIVGEEVSVFMVSKRRRVGDAAGDKKRRDCVQSIKYSPAIDSYIIASQKGAVSVWSSKESVWVTGCDYLPSIRRVAVCTERSIAIWDNRSKGKGENVFIIKPIEHSPQCMIYLPRTTGPHEDTILYGDDQGYINLMIVAAKDLTMKNGKGDKKNSPSYVIEPHKMANPVVRRKLHDDWVLKVKYFPDLRCFGSCSPSSNQSFVLEELERLSDNGEVRSVSLSKGVNAFDYCVRANIIATGGVDKIIRVWHPHIWSRPTGKLLGHLFTIVEIVCNQKDQHLISLSTARVFRIWDIHTLTCLQVFTDNEERPGEKRIYSMIFDNKHEKLVTGSSVIDAWPLTRSVQDTMQVPHTHDRPVTQILYNKELNQIVSVCTESVIKVWEIESGKLVHTITDSHGTGIELTSMTLDKTGYRLVTGGYDGSIKVWDFGSGQEIKGKEGTGGGEEDHSINGLVYFKFGQDDDHLIIASGFDNKIKIFSDSGDCGKIEFIQVFSDIYYLSRDMSETVSSTEFNNRSILPNIGNSNPQITNIMKKEMIYNTHNITCMTNISESLFITGCSNGNLVLWDLDKSVVEKIFELPIDINNGQSKRSKLNGDHAVHSVQVLIRTVRRSDLVNSKSNDENTGSDVHHTTSVNNHHTPTNQEPRSTSNENTKVSGDSPDKIKNTNEVSNSQQTQALTETPSPRKQGEDQKKKVDFHDSLLEDKIIVAKYEPILVSTHQDSYIRFWTLNGDLLREISPLSKRQGIPITTVCCDEDCNIMVTGDQNGYLTLWDIGAFLEEPESEEYDLIKQVLGWRGHLAKVVSLVYIDNISAIVSASVDGSVRVWWGRKGRFVGFFSQPRPFNFPVSEETAGPLVLPYDVVEPPVAPSRKKSATQRIRPVQKFEYPLFFDKARWQPFRHSAYIRTKTIKQQPEDKKFFKALVKPRAYNHHLNSSVTGDKRQGAVFRALPVYRVYTPEKPKTPDMSYNYEEEQGNILNFGATNNRGGRTIGKGEKIRSQSPNKSSRKGALSRSSVGHYTSRSSRYTTSSLSSATRS
ncbi:hypothetical protein LOTGIDRAFT_230398 [Lottia gigantea]|uniref:WD repeat-containing protein 64 n=1 Tax=Lottia gigantea TaxID=225164 RepID=V4CKX9_LOTGI|nr:hypothetical protein LOTGIDRAFT_230398 [Lottia gigantea]ESP02905.1 hypothetical protein LOTGIDRAFT_230398 [Lottia gigantea]